MMPRHFRAFRDAGNSSAGVFLIRQDWEFLRLHFFIDRQDRKFVIGEVTDHLDTAGTRRKR